MVVCDGRALHHHLLLLAKLRNPPLPALAGWVQAAAQQQEAPAAAAEALGGADGGSGDGAGQGEAGAGGAAASGGGTAWAKMMNLLMQLRKVGAGARGWRLMGGGANRRWGRRKGGRRGGGALWQRPWPCGKCPAGALAG